MGNDAPIQLGCREVYNERLKTRAPSVFLRKRQSRGRGIIMRKLIGTGGCGREEFV
jgi:hypothetical protein